MIDELREHEEFLYRELEELLGECEGCPHKHDLGKEYCIDCGIDNNIRNIEMEIKEIEEGLEEL